jgi:CBS domain containing-hemolysin-like protein
LVVARLQRLPRLGDRVSIGGMEAEILAISRRRVTRVRMRLPPGRALTPP